MRNLILILFLVIHGVYLNSQTRYVSSSATGSGDGLSDVTAWTMSQAMSATAGMDVYIKKGNYGIVNLVQSNNGTSNSPIRFIGYDTTIGDINTTNRATYTRKEVYSGSVLPFFDGGLTDGNIATSGTFLIINGDFVEFHNIAAKGFLDGYRNNGDDNTLLNAHGDFMGDFRANNADAGFTYYVGRCYTGTGQRGTLLNCHFRDADAQSVTIDGSNYDVDNVEVVLTGDYMNTTDYPFLIGGGSSNHTINNVSIIRDIGAVGNPHGFCWKAEGSNSSGTVVDGLYLENTRLELQFTFCNNNTIRNVEINGQGTQAGNDRQADLTIINGAHDNLLENIWIHNTHVAFNFSDWDDSVSEANGDGANAGYNNRFVNAQVNDAWVNVINIKYSNSGGVLGPYDTSWYNLSVFDSPWMFRIDMPHNGLQFYNSTVHTITTAWALLESGATLNTDTTFNKFNHFNAQNPDLTPYTDIDVTSVSYAYTDVANGDFSITSDALEIGGNFSIQEPRQGFDYNGLARTVPYTLGAVERNGGTSPSVVAKKKAAQNIVLGLMTN